MLKKKLKWPQTLRLEIAGQLSGSWIDDALEIVRWIQIVPEVEA